MPLDNSKRCFIKMQVKMVKNRIRINKNSYLNYCEQVDQAKPTASTLTTTSKTTTTTSTTTKMTTTTTERPISNVTRKPLNSLTVSCDDEELKVHFKTCVNKCFTGGDVAACFSDCSTDDATRKAQCEGDLKSLYRGVGNKSRLFKLRKRNLFP